MACAPHGISDRKLRSEINTPYFQPENVGNFYQDLSSNKLSIYSSWTCETPLVPILATSNYFAPTREETYSGFSRIFNIRTVKEYEIKLNLDYKRQFRFFLCLIGLLALIPVLVFLKAPDSLALLYCVFLIAVSFLLAFSTRGKLERLLIKGDHMESSKLGKISYSQISGLKKFSFNESTCLVHLYDGRKFLILPQGSGFFKYYTADEKYNELIRILELKCQLTTKTK